MFILVDYNIFPMVLVDQNPFYYAAAGGVILGLATTLNYALRGRVTGMSGMVYGILSLHKQDLNEKLGIVGGMLVAAGVFFDAFGYGSINRLTPFGPKEAITTQTSFLGYAVAGLLTGFGTKLSNGCTSGHGLCGLPRFSIRSFVAVCVFLLTGICISTLRYHQTLGPLSTEQLNPQFDYNHPVSANTCIAIGAILPIIGGCIRSSLPANKMTSKEIVVDQVIIFLVGLLFGIGLLVSGMVRRSNILSFLALGENWNPSLLFVLGCGVLINFASFNYMLRVKKQSYLGRHLFNPENKEIDWKLVSGACCFGLGWGISGLCPGPAIMQLSIFTVPVHVLWFGSMLIGMVISRKLQNHLQQIQQKEKHTKRPEIEESQPPKHHHKHYHHNAPLNLNDNSILAEVQTHELASFPINLLKQQSDATAPQTFLSSSLVKISSDLDSPSKQQ